ncbi:hypothetical protein GE061_018230 [Apolygus lucorum]|uniref:Uncharacterized protein n=1 Tax=Apolygus lucorum TaxID=248454 RepID=A0A6A4IH75_APOLU|nr:hypothetical protein GE061_018230 [Apolygus lucorum]
MLPTAPAALLLAFASIASAAKLPSYIKPCKADRKLNECALKRGREIIPILSKGDPSIRVPVLEPLLLDRVDLKPQGSLELRLSCYNCHVHGLSKAKLLDISLDLRKRHIALKLKIPRLMVIGKYDVLGKVLLFPITGKGVANLTLSDVDVEAALGYRLHKKKKEEFAEAIKHQVKFDAADFKISLTNLFNGDKLLGDNMNLILNDNWKEVLNDLKPSISSTVGQIIVTIINQIFELIPYSQFFVKN